MKAIDCGRRLVVAVDGVERVFDLPEDQRICFVSVSDKNLKNCTYPQGKESVVNAIKKMGQKLIDEAEKIWDDELNGERVFQVDFSGTIAVNELPTLEVTKYKHIL